MNISVEQKEFEKWVTENTDLSLKYRIYQEKRIYCDTRTHMAYHAWLAAKKFYTGGENE